jgi:hypothetical protein
MSNVVDFKSADKFQVDYIYDDGKIVGVKHPKWPFRIQRKDDKIALVSECDNEPFGILSADEFNAIIMAWLLIDDPELIDCAKGDEE